MPAGAGVRPGRGGSRQPVAALPQLCLTSGHPCCVRNSAACRAGWSAVRACAGNGRPIPARRAGGHHYLSTGTRYGLRIKRVRYGWRLIRTFCSILGSLLRRSRRPSRRAGAAVGPNSGCCDSASRTWRLCARSGRHARTGPSVRTALSTFSQQALADTAEAGIPIRFFPRSPRLRWPSNFARHNT